MDGFKIMERIAIAIAVLFFALGCLAINSQPETQTIDLSTQVEDLAQEHGVPFDRKNSLEYRFSESEGFGGAGGQSGTLSAATSQADLVQMADNDENKKATIHYMLKTNYINAEKFYWTYTEGTYFYWKDTYDMPLGYAITDQTNSRISLAKDMRLGVLQSAFCGGMLGFIAFVIMMILAFGIALVRR